MKRIPTAELQQLHVRIPPELHREPELLAVRIGQPMNTLVADAIRALLRKHSRRKV